MKTGVNCRNFEILALYSFFWDGSSGEIGRKFVGIRKYQSL